MFDWLVSFSFWIVYDIFWLSGSIASALDFFIYDFIKILLLLLFITHFMTLLNTYLPFDKIRKFLANRKLFGLEYFLAALFWAITPFCSCSSIALFVWLLKAWVPLWLTFSFLITSPLVNEIAIALFIGLFWFKITLIYVISGIVLGVLWWFIIGKLNLEKYVAEFVWKGNKNIDKSSNELSLKTKFKHISKEALGIIKQITPYLAVWIMIGAIIHGYVPFGYFEQYISKDNILAVPLAVFLGIPLYVNASGAIPIVQSLIAKGIPLGTGLAFMMWMVWLSLPEFLILKKVMKIKLLLIFFGIGAFFMILLWYFYNIIF